jgi:ATP-dependent Clp protease ATP-binding subunit ClpC
VLQLSLREAIALGHGFVGTEHILLGLLREDEDEGVATRMLDGLGVDRTGSVRK